MKFKLDENFGTRTQELFRRSGHDVKTVREQGLEGCSDIQLYEMCCAEQRCLITLNLHFADVIRFPAEKTGGIVIIRVPRNPSLNLLQQLIQQFLNSLSKLQLKKNLFIVEIGRIRLHQSETEDEL